MNRSLTFFFLGGGITERVFAVDSEDARANWTRAILAPVRDAGIEGGRDAAQRTHELSSARELKPDAASRTEDGASSLASRSFMGLLDRFDRWVDDDRDKPPPPTAEGGRMPMTHSAGSQVTDPPTPPLPPPPPPTAAPPGHGYGLSALSQLFSVAGPGEGGTECVANVLLIANVLLKCC